MIQKIYSVFDSKTGVYSHPILRVTRGSALRDFSDEVSNPQSPYAKHPADFTFYELGEYDDNLGYVLNHDPKVSLGTALELQSATTNMKGLQ